MINKNNNNCSGQRPHNFQASGLAVAVALVSSPLWAGDTIEFEDGTTIDWSVTTSYGIGTRLGNPFGLALDCYDGTPQRINAPEPTRPAPSGLSPQAPQGGTTP